MPASRRGGSTKGSRPNNGGKRAGTGPKPDLVGKVQEIDAALLHHRHKLKTADLAALRDALGATLQNVRGLMTEEQEWDETEVL